MEFDGQQIRDIASWLLLGGGAFFTLVGALGLLKLQDLFARMHGAGMIDTLGVGLMMLGLILQAEDGIVVIKLFLVLGFIFFTSPTTSYALARATLHGGVRPKTNADGAAGDKPQGDKPSKT